MRIKQQVYELVAPGQYQAKVVAVDQDEGNWGPYLRFSFQLVDGDGADSIVTGICSAKFSGRTKLYGWVRAILGGASIPSSYDLDTVHLVGRRCLVILGVEVKDDTEFNRVEAILPLAAGAPPPWHKLPDYTSAPSAFSAPA